MRKIDEVFTCEYKDKQFKIDEVLAYQRKQTHGYINALYENILTPESSQFEIAVAAALSSLATSVELLTLKINSPEEEKANEQ